VSATYLLWNLELLRIEEELAVSAHVPLEISTKICRNTKRKPPAGFLFVYSQAEFQLRGFVEGASGGLLAGSIYANT